MSIYSNIDVSEVSYVATTRGGTILILHLTIIANWYFNICDWILENSSKSHIFISVYLSLQHEKYCISNNIS